MENTTGSRGNLIEGLGPDAKPEAVIAGYDKIAGYITGKEGAKVKIGCFYDFKNKKAFEKPEVVYIFRVGKRTVEVKASDPLPLEVQAAHSVDQEEKKVRKARKPKSKK